MSAIEQLAAYLEDFRDDVAWASTGQEAAKHIANVLGWHPPARVIETAEALEALPSGAVVVTDWGHVCHRGPGGGRWWMPGEQDPMTSAEVFAAAEISERPGATLTLVHVTNTAALWSPTEKAGQS